MPKMASGAADEPPKLALKAIDVSELIEYVEPALMVGIDCICEFVLPLIFWAV